MSIELKSYYENHPWWWAAFFFAIGGTCTVATGSFLYVAPRDRDIAVLQKQLDTVSTNGTPEMQELRNKLAGAESSRDESTKRAQMLQTRVAACDTDAYISSEIQRITQAKAAAEQEVDFLLGPEMNHHSEPEQDNVLRSNAYQRQADQDQAQILMLQSKFQR
ncbi:hypothetical protein [Paraburkholderia sp. RL17-337-BIB-A]|uniref:hypothetical protein n=1 Tax=Paraburkholderia sp. RL17-337-BIB-A TaxID=3031636 RepID=UPI0038B93607